MNIWEVILLCFAFQGLTTAFFLIVKKGPYKKANTLWAIFLILFSLNITYNILFWAYPHLNFTTSLSLVYLIPFSLYGPLFYLYIKALVGTRPISKKEVIIHLIPTVLVVLNFSYYFGLPVERKTVLKSRENFGDSFPISPSGAYIGICVLMLLYLFYTYKTVKRSFEQDGEMKLWLSMITGIFFLFGLSWMVYFVMSKLGVLEIEHDYFITFFMVILIGLTSYFGFIYPEIFNGKSLKKVFPIIKYEKSGLTKSVLLDLKEKLLNVMEYKSLYLNSDLNLMDLAGELNVSRHHASQIINECFGMSFYEYINKYRIEEATKLLMDEDATYLNISEIAFKSGFNNRMSFYNAFKKHIGITPTQYRNQNLASR